MSRVVLLLLAWAFVEKTSAVSVSEEAHYHRAHEWKDSCKNEYYCTVPSRYYPTDHINNLLRNMTVKFDRKNVIPFNHRSGDSIMRQYCLPDINEKPIYEIIDNAGKLRYVVQSEKYFKQIIPVEKCKHRGKINRSYMDLNLSCEEKRINYNFIVLSKDGKQFELVSVADGLPIMCYCYML